MKIIDVFLVLGLSLAVTYLAQNTAFAQYKIPSYVLGSGGATVSSSGFSVCFTIGQTLIGNAIESQDFKITSGFWYTFDKNTVTGVVKTDYVVPALYLLHQNYPNPFNPLTEIQFGLPSRTIVSLRIFNMLGQEIETLAEGEYEAGTYSVDWEAKDLPSGIYFYRLQAGRFVETKKMLLLK